MSPMRVLVAAVAGGVIMFVWGALAHTALPIGKMGMDNLPAAEALLPAMKAAIPERGLYFFPPLDDDADEAEIAAWQEQYRSGPRGILVFDPQGGEPMSPAQLGTEFLSGLAAALVLAVVLSMLRCGRMGRVLAAGALGVFATLSIDASYWNWYRFPDDAVIASLLEQGIGWLLAGAGIALVLGRRGRRGGEAASA